MKKHKKCSLPDGSYIEYLRLFSVFHQKHGTVTDNPLIICVNKIYVKKIENRIIFKIKSGYYLELLTPETMKLLGSTENEITKYKNGNNVPDLDITEVILVHCISR